MVASVGGRHTLSCFYELVLPRRAASDGQEQTAMLGGQGTLWGPASPWQGGLAWPQPRVQGKGTDGRSLSQMVLGNFPQALSTGSLASPQHTLNQACPVPMQLTLVCLMSWFLGVSAGGHACGHPAHRPGSRGSPREEIKGRRGGG